MIGCPISLKSYIYTVYVVKLYLIKHCRLFPSAQYVSYCKLIDYNQLV